jgi:DNA repair protein RadC
MSKRNPETLNLIMDYAAVMEACAAYCEVKRPAIKEPEKAVEILRPFLTAASNGDKQECLCVILLDTKNRVIGGPRVATLGLLNSSPVHPRETFRAAVMDGAASVIIAHNHPSGDPTPSTEDIDVTRRFVEAGKILGIGVVDHIILGRAEPGAAGFMSLRDKNLVAFE